MTGTNESEQRYKISPNSASANEYVAGDFCASCSETGPQSQVTASSSDTFEQPVNIGKHSFKRTLTKDGCPEATDVAGYLIYLAASEPEPEFLTHMRLQKLLYYVQGWSLALRKRPMFSDRIEAWAHGPVVRDLYPHFAAHGDKPITPQDLLISGHLSQDDKELIESVWEAYKVYSGSSLRAMTHSEAPWRDARGQCAPADRCATEITQDALRRFFTQASKQHGQRA